MPKGKPKGNGYEREVCRLLSMWWSDGTDDNVFWRSASSGGRATQRGKKGKNTTGHYGDISATDHVGAPFLKAITLEIKRGYSTSSIQDLIDKREGAATQEYEKWILQAQVSRKLSGAYAWGIILRRNQRQALITFPSVLIREIHKAQGKVIPRIVPTASVEFIAEVGEEEMNITVMLLESFFMYITPEMVKVFVEGLEC